ncbi:MAG: aconitate hydratase AcnA [Chloroflexi bacterium]|nr:aconitate hydratase AcnA [Chloroflexota bacterium]
MVTRIDPLGARATLTLSSGSADYYRLAAVADVAGDLARLPVTVRIFLENTLRFAGNGVVEVDHALALARWQPNAAGAGEFPFMPARVVLQDLTGVPCVVDLAAMRSAIARKNGDPTRVNPLVPADLVIDHSVQVDLFGSLYAFERNVELEYERNKERYALLRWAQQAFQNFRVVPPGTGIVHQVNLEYLAKVVQTRAGGARPLAYPDTLVGTDSHTTMINALGVLGWGVGGIEAEAVLLGQPLFQLTPIVVGVRLYGELGEGVTATDLVLTVTQLLRKHGVVDKFVEFFGPGLSALSLPDRATLANMAPEYGATAGLFPVDDETLRYLRMTGRDIETVDLVERYSKEQGLFRRDATPDPQYSELVELDLSTVEPSLAGPKNPQERVSLREVSASFRSSFPALFPAGGKQSNSHVREVQAEFDGTTAKMRDGSVAIAAITSCTNTSNPVVMMGAGLLAKKAIERGLAVKPFVKTSLAPGSRAVTDYLVNAGLMPFLEALRFHLVGYGCTTCIGNSGLVLEPVAKAVQEQDLVVTAVLSGNRNFAGRINPAVRAQYLASPPLVVAYALAGTVDIDLTKDPLGHDPNGDPVYLRDIWPSKEEIAAAIGEAVTPEVFTKNYAHVFEGDDRWKLLPVPQGKSYEWDSESTYVQEPPFLRHLPALPPPVGDITGARALGVFGDSVSTDHISPAGSIAKDSPAGKYLLAHGVTQQDFNTYGARRGNHEIMMRGTFANIRLRNLLAQGKEGNWTRHLPSGELMSMYDAAMRYISEGTPLIVLAGKDYGMGSSRDWAAKGTLLLGIRAVIAESFERIHRSNLVGMGVLPLVYLPGQNRAVLGLTGEEAFDILGLERIEPRQHLPIRATASDGKVTTFEVIARLDSPVDLLYYQHGGVLPYVLRQLMHDL